MSRHHANYKAYLNQLYREADQEPLSKYLPGRAQRMQAVKRGGAALASLRRAEAIFNKLMRRST